MMYDGLLECVTVDGVEYPIETDFRVWVELYDRICNGSTNGDKANALLGFISDAGLPLEPGSVDAIMRFFTCGAQGEGKAGGVSTPVFDFVRDSEYIYAAFLETYGIDLTHDPLHWQSFIALFRSLPDTCQICKIMHYRSAKMEDVPKHQKRFYAEMKRKYALNGSNQGKTLKEYVEELKKQQAERQVPALRSGEQPGDDCT